MRNAQTLPVILLVLGAAGCSDQATPTQPTPAGPGTEALRASLSVSVDSLGSAEAIAALSEVTFDARQSVGQGLVYRIDFGDGTTASQSMVKHVYENPGVFTAAVTVTSGGQSATDSRQVIVASPSGSWLHRAPAGRPQRLHVRTLSLTSQNGRTVRGVLGTPNQPDRTVTGTLSGERNIRITTDDQAEAFEGMLPGTISGKYSLALLARGGPADNAPLKFDPLSGPPAGPGPDVSFSIRFFSFSAPYAVQGYSPILFDASPSRGDDLRYFIEFGDGEVSSDISAVHPIDREGNYTATFTVVDRFGRVNTESGTFAVQSLVAKGYYVWWFTTGHRRILNFTSQNGDQVGGELRDLSTGAHGEPPQWYFTGTLSGQNHVRLHLTGTDIVLEGTLTLGDYFATRLVLTQTGGPDNGKVWEFSFRNGY